MYTDDQWAEIESLENEIERLENELEALEDELGAMDIDDEDYDEKQTWYIDEIKELEDQIITTREELKWAREG